MFLIKVTRFLEIFPAGCDVLGNVIIIVRITWIQTKIHNFASLFSWPATLNDYWYSQRVEWPSPQMFHVELCTILEQMIFRTALAVSACFQWLIWKPVKCLRWSFLPKYLTPKKAVNCFGKKISILDVWLGFQYVWFSSCFFYKFNATMQTMRFLKEKSTKVLRSKTLQVLGLQLY